tara:strand:+ start:26130 stop:27209 length:1080 start_codon:yes stop_codon:yes gene_type:complete
MITQQHSVYLDLFRFVAAVFVFAAHATVYSGGQLWSLGQFGHEAVVLFFVLSGFVISLVVLDKKESAFFYATNRFTRIYSTAIPSLILTAVIFYFGIIADENMFSAFDDNNANPLWIVFSSVVFINQSWIATPVFINLPYWSLGYEVLYYVFFGVAVYSKGYARIILLASVLLVMGPSVALYLPLWLLGVVCFIALKKYECSFVFSFVLFLLSIIGCVVFSIGFVQDFINYKAKVFFGFEFYSYLLNPADRFASDYALSVFVAMNIFSASGVTKKLSIFSGVCIKYIKWLASHTFSIYLYHYPILVAFSYIFKSKESPFLNFIACWPVTFMLVVMLSVYTESKKYSYKLFFCRMASRLR